MEVLILAFMTATQTFDLPPGLLRSICFVESSYRIHAVNKDDGDERSLGVCQIQLPRAKMLGFKGTEKELMTPVTNVHYAGKFLRKNLDRYSGDVVKAVAAYNSGTYKQGRNGHAVNVKYVTKVLKAWSTQK